MARNAKTAAIPLCLACILFCLTLISVYMTSGLFAKYTAAAGGRDSARVIRFGNITITESGDFGEDGTLMIIPGVDLTKKAVIDFEGSEAAVYIFVEVTLSSDWSRTDSGIFTVSSGTETQLQWKVEDGWSYLKTDGSGSYVYCRELAPNTPMSADIIAENGRIFVSGAITKSEIGGLNGLFIQFRASAVQSIGFEDPAAAWNSLEGQGEAK